MFAHNVYYVKYNFGENYRFFPFRALRVFYDACRHYRSLNVLQFNYGIQFENNCETLRHTYESYVSHIDLLHENSIQNTTINSRNYIFLSQTAKQ